MAESDARPSEPKQRQRTLLWREEQSGGHNYPCGALTERFALFLCFFVFAQGGGGCVLSTGNGWQQQEPQRQTGFQDPIV